MNTVRRLGLQAWLGAAFVLLGAVASMIALGVVLPNLEGPIRKDEGTKVEDSARVMLGALANQPRSRLALVESAGSIADQRDADVRVSMMTDEGLKEIISRRSHGYLGPTESSVGIRAGSLHVAETTAEVKRFGGSDVVTAAVKLNYDHEDGSNVYTPAIVEVAIPVRGTAERLAGIRRRVLLAISSVLGLALISGFAVSRLLGVRMRRLASTAATLAQGDLSARARMQSPAELTSLAGSLNTMAARLEGLVDETVSDRDRAEGLVASLAEGVLAVSDRGEVTVANTAARKLLGVAQEVTHLDLQVLPESVRQVWDEARDGLERTSVVEASLPGGVSLLLQAVRVSREAGVVITIRDITEERRLNRARRDLIANVSHELKTPLTAVKGFLELIEDEQMDPARRKEFVGLMELEVRRLERLIAEQLELARIDAGALPLERGPHDLAAIAEDVAASRRHLADLNGAELVASIPPNPVIADVDPARVEQILLILLDNAIKHTPQGGKITVGVGVERDAATLTVRDTGAGIAPEAQPFIFDRFYQADQSREGPGLGLGLAIARGLVEAHGGSVDVRSAIGVGSVFIVRLPLRAGAPTKVGIRS